MSSLPPPPNYRNLAAILAQPVARYVHLTVYYHKPLPPASFELLKAAIGAISIDWMKYARDSWVLYTTETPESIHQKLVSMVPDLKGDSILTFYFDVNGRKGGQQVEWVWNWFNKKR
jgi:hypothetical protein